jgi:hypothetical protein
MGDLHSGHPKRAVVTKRRLGPNTAYDEKSETGVGRGPVLETGPLGVTNSSCPFPLGNTRLLALYSDGGQIPGPHDPEQAPDRKRDTCIDSFLPSWWSSLSPPFSPIYRRRRKTFGEKGAKSKNIFGLG